MKILSLFFNPIAYYPPMLHAFKLLADDGNDLTSFSIGENDQYLKLGKSINIRTLIRRSSEKGSVGTLLFFLRFCKKIISDVNINNYKLVILYDDIGLLAWFMIRPFCRYKPDIWYHNHDVTEAQNVNKLSLAYLSIVAQKWIFKDISMFSIPSTERLQYFPLKQFRGTLFHLPNYPAKYLFDPLLKDRVKSFDNGIIKVIYQGRVADGHGIIEFIDFLKDQINIVFTVVGPSSPDFLTKIKNKIISTDTESRVSLLPPLIYEDLLLLTAEHDIGLAINIPKDIIYSTGGTASNKLYEYAALGLPTLYFDHEHYRKYLSSFSWAYPVDLSANKFDAAISDIMSKYKPLSDNAISDFRLIFNFELEFQKIILFINNRYGRI